MLSGGCGMMGYMLHALCIISNGEMHVCMSTKSVLIGMIEHVSTS